MSRHAGYKTSFVLNSTEHEIIHGEHSAILSTFIKLSFVIKIFVLSILSGCLDR